MADAIRILGPMALELVESGRRTGVTEEALLRSLNASLRVGRITSFGSAEDAVRTFRASLGLLVEESPGRYSFLHLTFLEYFAARELARSARLEQLAADPAHLFQPDWLEPVVLALGVLGHVQVDDDRLARVTRLVVESAKRVRSTPTASVPALMIGILADDLPLDAATLDALVEELIPAWWLDAEYPGADAQQVLWSLLEARVLCEAQPSLDAAIRRLAAVHGSHVSSATSAALDRLGVNAWSAFLMVMDLTEVGSSAATELFLRRDPSRRFRPLTPVFDEGRVHVDVPGCLVRAAHGGTPFELVVARLAPFEIVWRTPLAILEAGRQPARIAVPGTFDSERALLTAVVLADAEHPFTTPWWGDELAPNEPE